MRKCWAFKEKFIISSHLASHQTPSRSLSVRIFVHFFGVLLCYRNQITFLSNPTQIIGFRYNTHNISLTLHNNEKVIDSLTLCSSPQHSPSTIVQLLAFQIKLKNLSLSWDGRRRRHWATREQYWFFILCIWYSYYAMVVYASIWLSARVFFLFSYFFGISARFRLSMINWPFLVSSPILLTWYSIIFQFKEENIARGSHGPGVLIFSPLFAKVSSPMLSCFAYFSFCFQFFQFNRGSSHRRNLSEHSIEPLSHVELDRQC